MDCNNCNQNAHYLNRNSRNMVSGGMNSGRNNYGNMMQNRNGCGNMNQTRNTYNNMNQTGNACNNMNQTGNTCGNMNQTRNVYNNMNQTRNTGYNMNQTRNKGDNMQRETRNYDNSDSGKKECSCMKNMHQDKRNEGCDRGNEPVDKMMPAMGYVPWQKWEDVYCIEEGLENGTIFSQLNKPYIGRRSK